MNQKGYTNGYSRILDRIAGDQVPQDLDLAPNIMARIQKQKGFHMQPRMRFFTAAGLVALVLIVMVSTVPGVAAALGRWFGYVPGVGFVREGQIRVLAEPVSVTRAGTTVTVEQVLLDPEQTVLVYAVEGIPSTAVVAAPLDQHCPYKVALRLPDGSQRLATPNGLQYWGTGYQHRFYYPPVPAAVNDVTLVIDCLFNTLPGAAPENWEIPLHFVPAPPNMTAFPVIEIPTATAPAASGDTGAAAKDASAEAPVPTQTLPASAAETHKPVVDPSPQPVAMSLTLDRAVQMDDGYLIYATVHWKDTPFASVDMIDNTERLHLRDASGQDMLYEIHYDEKIGVNVDQRQTVFAIKTAPVQSAGPLTLVLDSVSATLPVNASFVFDPGPDPKTGQTWNLNQEVKIDQYHLRVRTATAELGGYSFEMSSEDGIINASLADLEHAIGSGGGGGGGSSEPGQTFFSAFNYADGQLPKGPLTITVGSISVSHVQRMEAQWTPPAVSAKPLPTRPAACLTKAAWKAALAQKPPLPSGITGHVLANGQFDKPNSDQWSVVIYNLDGSKKLAIPGAQDGSIAPDGSKLAYSTFGKGIAIMDLSTEQAAPLPGTGNGDFNPIWSPDSKQIVFNRGMGIFDLFIVDADGSNMRQITHGGVQEWPVGWLPDGRLLYSVPGRENEYTNYAVDIPSGKADLYPDANLSSVSPDGKYTLTSERTFGDRWLVSVSDLDGSNRWQLNDASLLVLTSVWSPDGEWLLTEVSGTGPEAVIGTLINLNTCQVIPLPDLKGNILSWTP